MVRPLRFGYITYKIENLTGKISYNNKLSYNNKMSYKNKENYKT